MSFVFVYNIYLVIYEKYDFMIFLVAFAARRRRDIKILLCLLAPGAGKFNIVSNDHGRTQKCDFSFRPELL